MKVAHLACRCLPSPRSLRSLLAGAVLAGLALACADGGAPRPAPPRPRVQGVRLVVVVVVDQLGWDTLARFRPALRGGLARLLAEGVVFRQAFHRHATTTTAPGHATLVTGLTPRHHGVVANHWFDRSVGREVDAAQDPFSGEAGPSQLLSSALPDWVRQRDPWGRTYSAGGKARSAVMLGGKRPYGAFWFDPAVGGFVTSHRYGRAPAWVSAFDRRPFLRERFGTLWQPLPLPPRVDPSRLGVVQLEGTGLPRPFPHAFAEASVTPDASFYQAIADSPVLDAYLAAFARELVARERLGADRHLDYLGLAFSAVDRVGHAYGPHSRETLDTVLRLDRELGDLLDYLEGRVGREHLLVALSADHGVAPLPERQRRLGLPGSRESPPGIACVQSVLRRLDEAHGQRRWFAADLYLDPFQVARSRVPRPALDREIVRWLRACPGVQRVWTRAELAPDQPAPEAQLTLYRASYLPSRSPDFVVQWKPWFVPDVDGATHGSPYAYDAQVPLVLWVPGAAPATVAQPVATVDLAPTLAALLGLRPPQRLDGEDRSSLVLREP